MTAGLNQSSIVEALPTNGPASPPRSNGELLFEAPWEGRAFGLMVSLLDQGIFTVGDFQAELISAIAEWESLERPTDEYRYYECWLVALERLVVAKTEVSDTEIAHLSSEFLTRPAGHDHAHEH